jgi:DNA ligase (NAD+)
MDKLVQDIKKYNDQYYNTGTSSISDDEYDVLKEKLRKLDPNHPLLFEVGADVVSGSKVALPVYMGSLDKVKTDLSKFLKNNKGAEKFYVSDKLDGISALLVVENGKKSLYTRGNGILGQDISSLLKYIKGVPKKLPVKHMVRGELIISLKDYEAMGEKKGANPRNTAAGIINTKKQTGLAKSLTFVAYNYIQHDDKKGYYLPEDEKKMLKNSYGYETVHYDEVSREQITFDVMSAMLQTRRANTLYEIDGIVITANAENAIEAGKNPSYSVAFKQMLTDNTAEVLVDKVEWNVSKDGLLKPVVIFDKVRLSGVNISRATGFNADFINSNKVGPGARIIITRSGDVIPHILKVISGAKAADMPDKEYIWKGKDIKLANKSDEQEMKELINFFTILGVDGLGPKLVQKIYEQGYHTVKDVIDMNSEAFISIPGFAKKIALYDAIKTKLATMNCIDLMKASNLFGAGFGAKKLTNIVDNIGSQEPTIENLVKISGVSEKTAVAYIEGYKKFQEFAKSVSMCTSSKKSSTKSKGSAWKDQIVVFTGVRNKTLEKEIEEQGGRVSTSISKNTTLVIAKDPGETSSKLDKARQLGIKIIALDSIHNVGHP